MKTAVPKFVKKHPLLVANTAWALAFGVTTVTLWQMKESPSSTDAELTEYQRKVLAGEDVVPRLARVASPGDSSQGSTNGGEGALPARLTAAEMESRMAAAIAINDPLARANQISALLMKLSPANLAEALAVLENGPRSGLDNELFESFMAEWGKMDGQAALEYAMNNESLRRIRGGDNIAINAWASQDPNAAINYLNGLEQGRNKQQLHHSVFEALLEQDVDRAAEFAMLNEPGDARGDSIRDLADAYFAKGGVQALQDWIDSIEPGEENGMTGYKSTAIERAAREIAESDPAAAVALVESHLGTDLLREGTYRTVARALSGEDPKQGADWLASLPESGQRNEAIAEEIEDWADDHPNDAGTWLSNQLAGGSNQALDPVVSSFAREIVSEDPESAIAWGSVIQDERLRNETLARVGRDWVRGDRDGAAAWLQSGKAPEPVQRQLSRFFR